MTAAYTHTPVLHPFEHYRFKVPKLLTITEQLASAEKKKAELTEQFKTLETQIKDVETQLETKYDFDTDIDLIRILRPALEKLRNELDEATNAVTELQKEKDAEDVERTKWNHERARENVMANEAIERAEREKLNNLIKQYNTLLEKYQKAAMWLTHKNSKTKIPADLFDDQWRLNDHELENKTLIDTKRFNLQSMYGTHFHNLDSIIKDYDAHVESVAARKPRNKSPPPSQEAAVEVQPQPSSYNPFSRLARGAWSRVTSLFPGKSSGGRSNKKGKKKTRRPNKKCTRRHSKKKSTRRH
jgi:hypothetical protein